jgi:CRP-like cAMP-binding protein
MRSHRNDPVAHELVSLGFERDAAIRLSFGGTLLDLPAGTTLCREGEPGLEAFLLLDGEASVLVGGNVVTLGAGDIVGELAALDATRTRNATVVAATDLRLLVFDVRTFRTLAAADELRARLLPERAAA